MPSQGAVSFAQALQSSAGSIGLRTQSITLMRDALFRMCEAYNNGAINEFEVAAFLRRSQDLTAAVLAIEQLTGAVAANQVILTGNAAASATASLLSNQAAVEEAKKRVAKKKEELKKAEETLTKKKDSLTDVKKEEANKQKTYDDAKEADDDESEVSTKEAKISLDAAKTETAKAEEEVKDAEDEVKDAERALDDAEKFEEAIRSVGEAAITSANASTGGAGEFSIVNSKKELDEKATEHIAKAVITIVEGVLNKEYSAEICLSYLIAISSKPSDSLLAREQFIYDFCSDAITDAVQKTLVGRHQPDGLSKKILNLLSSNKIKRSDISNWLTSQGIVSSPTLFIYDASFADARRRYLATNPGS